MSKILYIVDDNKTTEYNYDIKEDTIIYHYSINSSSVVNIDLVKEGVTLVYYYNNINYDDNSFKIKVNHLCAKTHSELFNNGVNVYDKKLKFDVEGIVLKDKIGCIVNQENQIINMRDGNSSILPKLLIDNYDVVSSHSAYIGKFKEDVLFYIMSRGISRSVAYRVLLNAFLLNTDSMDSKILERIKKEIDKI